MPNYNSKTPSIVIDDNLTSNASRPSAKLQNLALRGTIWLIGSQGLGQLIRFVSNLILARILFPEAFGIMALVNICIIGINMFSDLGIEASVIQNDRCDPDFLNTAWTIQIMRGFILCVAAIMVAIPFSAYYEQPILRYMLPVAGLGVLIDGFKSTALYTANRKLHLRKLQILDVSVQAIAASTMVIIAWLTHSIWALVSGSLVVSLTRLCASHLFFPEIRNRLRFDKEASRSILSFGIWLFLSSIVTFLAQTGDRLLFGKLIPLSMLGVYSIALTLNEVPTRLISQIAFKILFPSLSRIRREGGDINDAYNRACRLIIFFAGISSIGLSLFGPWIVKYLYDERYVEAVWIIRLFAIGIWINTLVHIQGSTLLACGRTKWLAAANASRLVWLIISVPLAFMHWDFSVAVLCVVLSDFPRYIAGGVGVRLDGLRIFKRDGFLSLLFGMCLGAGFLLTLLFPSPKGVYSAFTSTIFSLSLWGAVYYRTLVVELRNWNRSGIS